MLGTAPSPDRSTQQRDMTTGPKKATDDDVRPAVEDGEAHQYAGDVATRVFIGLLMPAERQAG